MKKAQIPTIPHSWSLKGWPPDIYPGDSTKASYVVRAHRTELINMGALVRVGRELVVLGAPYNAWLSQQGGRVKSFVMTPNRPRSAA